jgi:cellulose synthase/poly-beta-1,6-N-acetylglucosamine synthase-like glycosyltransferase
MSPAGQIVLVTYFGVLLVLAVYGCHRYYLLRLHYRHRPIAPGRPEPLTALPRVTVQLPVFNEFYVVERLIEAACRLDYPRERLEIQLLDDSTDETSSRAAAVVDLMRRNGHDVTHIRRSHRDGFKAGALAHGLRTAGGEFIAVFDADFVPGPRFLRDLLPHFSHPRVGMVQARWGHLNREFSSLTRIQAILLDGHFAIEHAARHRAGRFFNFNGTAGIWRRACIDTSGGWKHETLTEDLDLSYRAQLAGWQFVFAPEVVAPAELPADIDAFKSQQHRWTRGSIETGLRLLPRIARARLPAAVKTEAFFHLTNNLAYPLMVLLALLIVPAMLIRRGAGLDLVWLFDLPLFLMSTMSVSAFYLCSQREIGRRLGGAVAAMPMLMSLGIGLCVNNTRGVLGALSGRRTGFVRTPKYALCRLEGDYRDRQHRGAGRLAVRLIESAFAVYFTVAAVLATVDGLYAALPFLLLFQVGFAYVSILGWWNARRPLRKPAAART